MEHQQASKCLIKGLSKPLCFSQNSESIAVGEQNNQLLIISKHDPSSHIRFSTVKTDKTVSLKFTDTLLARAGIEGTVSLWDSRLLGKGAPIHVFNRPGCKFNALDISEHILAGGASKKIVFWDLRKMKQRCEFTESFNEDITALQFSKEINTTFFAATYDGLIAKFDLTEKNEEDAFVWGHQILQSPCFLQNKGNITLVQTQNQFLFTMEDDSVKDKLSVSSIEDPKHVLSCYLDQQRRITYFTRQMKTNAVNFWVQKHNIGYIPITSQIQMFIPLNNQKVLYADQKGNWFLEKVHEGKNYQKKTTFNQNFFTVEELQQGPKIVQDINKNGFIVNKPSSLKNSHKKFKPY